MNPLLREAIRLYIESCRKLFTQLANDLGVELPIKAQEWAMLDIEQSGISETGIKYRKHGYGVVMRHNDLVVDFDLGKDGELNGLDPWKLFYFAEENDIPLPCASTEELKGEFKSLAHAGELVCSGDMLYYLADSI